MKSTQRRQYLLSQGLCRNCGKPAYIKRNGKPAVWCAECFARKQERAKIQITCPDCQTFYSGSYEFNRHKKRGICERRQQRQYEKEKGKYRKGKRKYKPREYKPCVICGFTEVTIRHHIDRNRLNNSEDNIVYLCPNHHTMLHWGLLSRPDLLKQEATATGQVNDGF